MKLGDLMKKISAGELKKVVNGEELVVVDFYADWCMPCRYLSPILEKLEKEFKEVKFYKLNVDEEKDLAFELGISSIPTVLFFKKGKVVGGFIGALPESAVRSEIKKVLKM
ncbi:MAG: thioredoxin [Archaeoglobaceae archaeon]|nr:thioredoxin [Archaeoglobaceae archaeon]MCX8152131.1 thioredoxin [Archaeoglobaceae archaeon]MDW8013567.1 thioredoxin [Archaeoglobaceae archaeon]